jgi:rhodanese-related sulfurtransferase
MAQFRDIRDAYHQLEISFHQAVRALCRRGWRADRAAQYLSAR